MDLIIEFGCHRRDESIHGLFDLVNGFHGLWQIDFIHDLRVMNTLEAHILIVPTLLVTDLVWQKRVLILEVLDILGWCLDELIQWLFFFFIGRLFGF